MMLSSNEAGASHEASEILHSDAFDVFSSRWGTNARVLDLGCGTGEWVTRLLRGGFSNVLAVDRNAAFYRGAASFVAQDLNEGFGRELRSLSTQGWDVITAIEVIEHLDNLSHFLRECRDLLDQGGRLFLTTPNVECVPSRLKFLRNGRLRWFEDQCEPTHFTPVITSIFRRLCAREGYDIELHEWLPKSVIWNGTKRWKVPLCKILARAMQGAVYGDCHLFLLRRSV